MTGLPGARVWNRVAHEPGTDWHSNLDSQAHNKTPTERPTRAFVCTFTFAWPPSMPPSEYGSYLACYQQTMEDGRVRERNQLPSAKMYAGEEVTKAAVRTPSPSPFLHHAVRDPRRWQRWAACVPACSRS